MSKDKGRGKTDDAMTPNGEGLKRRDVLECQYVLAASALSGAGFGTSAQAQPA